MDNYNVFSSNITRAEHRHKNNLYELLNIVPAKPLKLNTVKNSTCNYIPKTDKYYISKRKSRLKVKTVRDVRKTFEQDTYTHLFTDLENQQKVLFKKIRFGSSEDNNTKKLANQILNDDMPISRSTWQMLINLNPEHHAHTRQFVLWNGKYILITGSRGGGNKLICNYDLAAKKLPSSNKKKNSFKQNAIYKRKGLLRNSLAVKFKPGPLSKKQFLDDSYQKYHVGEVELIHIPKAGLDIQPTYGTALEPTIVQFLNNFRKEDGTISQKWAELAASALGRIENSNAVQQSKACVTLDLFYKYNQNRLLMRRDTGNNISNSKLIELDTRPVNKNIKSTIQNELHVLPEIKDMMNKIINAVEINILQDKIFTEEQELKEEGEGLKPDTITHSKDKSKRKFCELDRLDVTVIRLPETEERYLTRSCTKLHCTLGCICASLKGPQGFKRHCGRMECMFDCTCDFSKNKDDLSYASRTEPIPELLDLNNEINLNLAKEEKKFHQTVIVTGRKNILLKGGKRNWKTSKKYADFYSNMTLKNENQIKKDLSIVALRLDCNNIEPWCMIHRLYKCFCKGKFTETCEPISNVTVPNLECLETNSKLTKADNKVNEFVLARNRLERTNSVQKPKTLENSDRFNEPTYSSTISECLNDDPVNETTKDKDEIYKTSSSSEIVLQNNRNGMITRHASKMADKGNVKPNSERDKYKNTEKISDSESNDCSDLLDNKLTAACSRTVPYEGRKYSNGYYQNINYRILEMEKNDKGLQERLAILHNTTLSLNNAAKSNTIKSSAKPTNVTTTLMELLCDGNEKDPLSKNSDSDIILCNSKRKRLSSETKLVAWLESNYKMYKYRNDQGLFKNSLEPPKLGKVALHSWEFILNRYRERKNLFLVTSQKPFRIFMAVNTRSPFFENCININSIRFADLNKYPQTVKNLLINATYLKDNFCILRGLSCCWELIGSVTKVSETDRQGGEHENTPENNVRSSMDTFIVNNQNDTSDENSFVDNIEQIGIKPDYSNAEKELIRNNATPEDAGSSKWFVMTIENDFSEIRFFRKGFFVKSDTIINAINVARLSGKTVRLSSKKCIDQSESPQFGIYAIPNNNEYSVFVGPYEMEDTLGIETIKTILDVRKLKRTRGFWITTSKVDNMKVVENPLSFVPVTNAENNKAMPLETHVSANNDMSKNQDVPESQSQTRVEDSKECSPTKKVVKPIKIRKTNGFYHLASGGVLKKISLPYHHNKTTSVSKVLSASTNTKTSTKQDADTNNVSIDCVTETLQEEDSTSISETMPQIKISAVFSQNDNLAETQKHERGMFILKPEEINRKLSQGKLMSETCTTPNGSINDDEGASFVNLLDSDAESWNNTSPEHGGIKDNIYVISDDENDTLSNESTNQYNLWKNVWIQCTNISNLGWIAGIRNMENKLSFKFPRYEYSDFFTEEEAFTKINSELFKRIDTSKKLIPQWNVTDSPDELQGQEINFEHLYPDYILTREGLLHTSDFIKSNKNTLKTYSKIQQKDKAPCREIDKVPLLDTKEEESVQTKED